MTTQNLTGALRVLVCGSRDWQNATAVHRRINELPEGSLVVHGGAKGADYYAEKAAARRGLHTAIFKPRWDIFGKQAGHKRNHAMLDLAPDLVIAFQRNGSSGTQGTIDEATRRGIPVERHAEGAE